MCKTVAHLSFDFRHGEFPRSICGRLLTSSTAENAAIDRGLPYEDFLDEFTPPATQMIRHQASTRAENHARPCFLMLHLYIRPWAPCDDRESYIWKAHWSATDDIPTTPARSSLFRHLNNLHLDISSLIAHASDDDSSSPPHSGALNISSSSRGISSLDVTNILSSVNGGITINGSHCPVILNCHITMRDNYSGGIYGGNVGGSNNINYSAYLISCISLRPLLLISPGYRLFVSVEHSPWHTHWGINAAPHTPFTQSLSHACFSMSQCLSYLTFGPATILTKYWQTGDKICEKELVNAMLTHELNVWDLWSVGGLISRSEGLA